jgi:hypothetical protein
MVRGALARSPRPFPLRFAVDFVQLVALSALVPNAASAQGSASPAPGEPAPATPDVTAPDATASDATEPEPEPAEEVVVVDRRPEVVQTTVGADEVRVLPGAFGDPFRAVDMLPSATPIVSGLPYYYLRGAAPNNNAFYVDGVRVPLLYHVGIGAGVVHAGLIDQVDVFPSAPPASYGGAIGAIVAGQTRPAARRFLGEGYLRLIDVGGLVEAPLGGRGHSLLVAGHYGYPGPILRAITPTVDLDYWDYQVRANWRVTDKGTLGVLAFGSHDYLASGTPLSEDFVSDFHRIDLRYDHALGGGQLRVAVTGGYDYRGASPSYLTDESGAARVELSHKLAARLRLRAGAGGRIDAYGFEHRTPVSDEDDPDVPSSVDPPPRNLTAGAYADVVWGAGPVELVPGVRFDVYSSKRAIEPGAERKTTATLPAVDPRLALRVSIAPPVDSITSAGLAHQFPSLRFGDVPGAVATGEGFAPGSARLQSAAHASQGFEFSLPEEFVASVTGFYSAFWGMTDLTATCYEIMPPTAGPTDGPPPRGPYFCPGNEPVRGRAYGLELMLRRSLSERFSVWLSYALSRSTRQAHFPTLEGGETVVTVPSEFDRTHVLNAALTVDLGVGWRAGTRFLFYSGAPYSPLEGSIPVPPYHGLRGPPFPRLDVRLEKRWELGETAFIALVIEGLNVTLSTESSTLGRDCDSRFGPDGGTTECRLSKIGPITIPSLGVEAAF